MKFGSVCSGIEAASVAWSPLGWKAEWLAEIEKFPSAILAHHYPQVKNLGDMTQIAREVLNGSVSAPDVLTGGTPCQAFSVAGMREGLTDPRGELTMKFVELADAIDYVRTGRREEPSIIIWENVPGVLSDKGNAFGCFLGALAGEDCELLSPGKRWQNAGCVYGPKRAIAWRVLDAQYFGLAQRRKRVFVVASAREGFDPAQVLFERDGMRRDSAPSRGKIKAVAALTANGVGTCGADDNQAQAGHLIAGTLNANGKAAGSATQQDAEAGMLVVHGTQDPGTSENLAFALGRNNGQENVIMDFSCNDSESESVHIAATAIRTANTSSNGWGISEGGPTYTLDASGGGQAIVTHEIQAGALRTNPASGPVGVGVQVDHAYTLEARAEVQAVQAGSAVRRLTPKECERLQGFPDDYTQIPWRNKSARECPDGPRYKAIGNSWAVPVARWVGMRVMKVLGDPE